MSHAKSGILRNLPSVNDLLQDDSLRFPADHIPRRKLLNDREEEPDEQQVHQTILNRVRDQLKKDMGPHYRRVVNATGIILHTALGRAVLSQRALKQIQQELSSYSLLQMDLRTGQRTQRDARIEWFLQKLTGAQAATVVNNNAAATALVLNTFASGKEVIVSRGHLVEIGGSFRLPEVMAASGARLVEVGTTNKTHRRDYENAITENTAAILRVHPSNYKIVGFAGEVPLDDLVQVAHDHNIILIDDVGAGALIDFSRFGFAYEPTLPDSIRTGADIVTSSGDKLIGAAQCGIILGRSELIKTVRKNPWSRILRVDKMTLTVLEGTLTSFLDENLALQEVPILAMLMRKPEELTRQSQRITQALKEQNCSAVLENVAGYSQMGSGSLPTQNLKTNLIAIQPANISAQKLAQRLREFRVPIITRIHEDKVLIDPRTLRGNDEELILEALHDILTEKT